MLVVGVLATGSAQAQTYTESVLYSFCSAPSCSDGAYPLYGALVLDAQGNLYGTTADGGTGGAGMVFKADTTGKETVLYTFTGTGEDGAAPYAGLVRDAQGNLYGTTLGGGNPTCEYVTGIYGCGTVFKVDTTGKETVLYTFCSASNCTDGGGPEANLVLDAQGNLYGTTRFGGSPACTPHGCGTVFKLDTTGKETVLYSFTGAGGDGRTPSASVVLDTQGNLYGTSAEGGNLECTEGYNGCGTVFKVDTTGKETVLYSFTGKPDGAGPYAGLVRDVQGNLYGTTDSGGANGEGTVFKVDTTGKETVLYSFCSVSKCPDGAQPVAGLVQDAQGNLYGTTDFGGATYYGTVFKVDTTGHETVLFSFCPAGYPNCTDGAQPMAGLVQDAQGNLYGTTFWGGDLVCNAPDGCGTVFKLTKNGGNGTATVTLTSGTNPSYVDQSVTFSALVSGSGATPTGSATFKEGTIAKGTETLADGQASLTMTFTKSGTDSIVASYSGDKNYNAANSKPLKQVVKQYTTSTALASSLNPSTYGQPVTLTATVTSAGPTPTGKVTFKNGSASLGSATLSGGGAKITKSTLLVGTLTITASYGGDSADAKSTSPDLTQVVDKATSTTTIVSSVNPSNAGQTVKFTATVTSPTTKPIGTVTFKDGTTALGTATLAKGKASYSTATLSAGSHNIAAVYVGTVNIAESTSPVLVQTVK